MMLTSNWQRATKALQYAVWGRVVISTRVEIRATLHGVEVRHRDGRDVNGMPRYKIGTAPTTSQS